MKMRVAAAAAVIALSLTPASALEIAAWDVDASGAVSETEFIEGFQAAGVFDAIDVDANGLVRFSELAEGLYDMWDANGDGELSVEEWDDAVDFWFGEDAIDLAASEWDADGDGVISGFEFADALREVDLIARFDSDDEDEFLDEGEVSSGLFELADDDGDGLIPVGEEGFFINVAGPVEIAGLVAAEGMAGPELDLIKAGEAFTQLPVPCEQNGSCEQVARDFCSTLGYQAPIDTLAVDGKLYVIRCADEP